MTKGAIQAASQAKKEQIIHVGQNLKIVRTKPIECRRSSEEGHCMEVDLVFGANTTIEEFIVTGSTQRKQKKKHAKKKQKEKRKRKAGSLNYFSRHIALLHCKKKNTRMEVTNE